MSFHGILDDGVRAQAVGSTAVQLSTAEVIASEDMSHPDAPRVLICHGDADPFISAENRAACGGLEPNLANKTCQIQTSLYVSRSVAGCLRGFMTSSTLWNLIRFSTAGASSSCADAKLVGTCWCWEVCDMDSPILPRRDHYSKEIGAHGEFKASRSSRL